MSLKFQGALNLSAGSVVEIPGRELNEPVRKKTNNLASNQVRHKLACTVTKDGERLEILDLESRGILLSE